MIKQGKSGKGKSGNPPPHAILFASLGLDTTTAIRLFLKQSVNQQRIPFDIVPPQEDFSEKTLAAVKEAKRISRDPKVKSYSSAKELLEDCD